MPSILPDNTCTRAFEPTLDEALADPIVLLVLARDGLKAGDVRRTLDAQSKRIRARALAPGCV